MTTTTARKVILSSFAGCCLALFFLLSGCYTKPEEPLFVPDIETLPAGLKKFEAMSIPASNPMTPEKVSLGRQLFFDPRLSVDQSKACASCHLCEKGLTDGLPKAIGAGNKQLPRSSPTLWNIGYHKEFYWDGRSGSLEAQGQAAWAGGNMGAKGSETEILGRIKAVPGYRQQFQKVFGAEATVENMFQAIAAYERTIIAGNDETAFDRWQAGDESAASEPAKRGYEVFKKAKCDNCHSGALLTDLQYHNVGVGSDAPEDKQDKGRFVASKTEKDTGAFKTPTLRDVAKSAPYFHDGSVATLEEAVDFMTGGGKPNKYLDTDNLKKAKLTATEKSELIEFLRSLSIDKCRVTKPKLP
jgi:cytochrome c peroxidase